MKSACLLLALCMSACVERVNHPGTGRVNDSAVSTVKEEMNSEKAARSVDTVWPDSSHYPDTKGLDFSLAPVHSNARFRDVWVQKQGEDRWQVSGQGQIFEASFGWAVEDGHNELAHGFEMTSAGAPEWGTFQFLVNVKKPRPGTTLTLILFETSAKDGSRMNELPIPLP